MQKPLLHRRVVHYGDRDGSETCAAQHCPVSRRQAAVVRFWHLLTERAQQMCRQLVVACGALLIPGPLRGAVIQRETTREGPGSSTVHAPVQHCNKHKVNADKHDLDLREDHISTQVKEKNAMWVSGPERLHAILNIPVIQIRWPKETLLF